MRLEIMFRLPLIHIFDIIVYPKSKRFQDFKTLVSVQQTIKWRKNNAIYETFLYAINRNTMLTLFILGFMLTILNLSNENSMLTMTVFNIESKNSLKDLNDALKIILARLANGLENGALVWKMVCNSSGQWFDTCLIKGQFGLELVWPEAASSALRVNNELRAPLIRGHFGLGRSDQRSHLSGTVWSEATSSETSTWLRLISLRFDFRKQFVKKNSKCHICGILLKEFQKKSILGPPLYILMMFLKQNPDSESMQELDLSDDLKSASRDQDEDIKIKEISCLRNMISQMLRIGIF